MSTFSLLSSWASALMETLGEAQATALMEALPPASPFHPADLLQALGERFGERGGAGVAVRLGEALFHHWPLPLEGPRQGWRWLPTVQRVSQGVAWLGQVVAQALDVHWRIQPGQEGWQIRLRHRWQGAPQRLGCALWQGFFQEALYWLAGKVYAVHCHPVDDPQAAWQCEFTIPFRSLY